MIFYRAIFVESSLRFLERLKRATLNVNSREEGTRRAFLGPYQETEMTSRVTFIGIVYLPRWYITAICVVFRERLAEIMPFDLRMSDERSRNRRLFRFKRSWPRRCCSPLLHLERREIVITIREKCDIFYMDFLYPR